ncbi:MAG: thiamine diphosphokinase [Rhizobiaceae bacterium]|nr:thiamine diphosphokinase [Rhizobiaceae bacterium]
MTAFAILLGGELSVSAQLIKELEGVRVLAADSGMRHASVLNIRPELWVGDFDSAGEELQKEFEDVERLGFDTDKDMTDGEIAIDAALERGATKLILVGAFGGERMEHEFCHLTQAVKLSRKGKKVEILDGTKEAHPIPTDNTLSLVTGPGKSFSVLAFSALSGLCISGAKWPLENADVPFGSGLTMSNETTGAVSLSLDSGNAIVLIER